MPAQLTHIKYAFGYLERRPELNRLEFLRGTTFPDIRRLAGLRRDMTHFTGVTQNDVHMEADSWQAGLLLHSYLDEAWNRYFSEKGLPADYFPEKTWSAVKIAEESAYCGRLVGRAEGAAALQRQATPQELAFGVAPELLRRWYAFVIWKLEVPYNTQMWRKHAVEMDFEAAKMERLLGRVEAIRVDSEWLQRIDELHTALGY